MSGRGLWNGMRPFLRAIERFQDVRSLFLQLDSTRRFGPMPLGILRCEIFDKKCEHEVTPHFFF
jgi:hypothetical protein